jgi:hypothetical protein
MKIKSMIGLALAGGLLAGCSTGSAVLDSVSSVGDRFSQLFGSNSQPVNTSAPQEDSELYCPDVLVREGTATLSSAVNGMSGPSAIRYQGTIARTARECVLSNGNTLNVKIGIQGRMITGPAGAPPTVDVPIRVAVVEEGMQPKTIFSRLYRTTVDMTDGNVPFSFVAEDVSYPAPSPEAHANYVYYVGFDPEGARQPPPRATRKKR